MKRIKRIIVGVLVAFFASPAAHAQHCPLPTTTATPAVDSDAPLQLHGAQMQSVDDNTITLSGNAELHRGGDNFTADTITYNRERGEVNASGSVTVRSAVGHIVRATEAQVALPDFTGEAAAVDYDMSNIGRGSAAHAELRGRNVLHLKDATYTQCPEGNNDVVLSASDITLDSESGFGVAKHAKLRFKNVPIFYLPRLTFPISDKRKSGFLFPKVGYNGDSGLVVEAPLYLNLHPSADATVTPAVHSRRGAQLALEARYLVRGGGGELRGAGLPNDNALQQRDRWAVDYRHRQTFSDNLHGTVDYRDVSDNRYLGDFADALASASATVLPAAAELRYDGRWRAQAGVTAYTVVDDAIAADDFPYDKLPYLNLSAQSATAVGAWRPEYAMRSSLVHFKRDNSLSGQRVRMRPSLRFPLRRGGGYFIPSFNLDYTRYRTDDSGRHETLSRTLPVFSVDSGLVFERRAGRFVQTLEPRVFYVATKNKAQENFPLFDTSQVRGDNYEQLFRDNLFFGGDRVDDANRISLGVESRLFDNNGAQTFRAALGRMFHLQQPQVKLTATDTINRRSDLIAEAHITPGGVWHGGAFARWSTARDRLSGGRLRLGFAPEADSGVEVAYQFRRADGGDADDTRQWRLRAWRRLGARWRVSLDEWYSVRHSRNVYADLAFTYDNCCWGITLRGRQRLLSDGDSRNSVLAEFRLKRLYNHAQQ